MAEHSVQDEDAILRVVRQWPHAQQVQLARRILDPGLETINPQTGRPYVMSGQLRGMAGGDNPPPSDEDVERWRLEKYRD